MISANSKAGTTIELNFAWTKGQKTSPSLMAGLDNRVDIQSFFL
jgi:hypothetical protein